MKTCHDCGAKEGQLHKLGCDMERCPSCGGQLITCYCYCKDTETGEWSNDIYEVDRVPYIIYPTICHKCGELWPDLFMVPNWEWEKYIEKAMRASVICRKCYDFIKQCIDKNV